MKKITRKKHLEMMIQSIPNHPKPYVGLEQYSTPSFIASDLLWNAFSLGDIENKNILDLCCGTGIFTIAPVLLGANFAIGVDIDINSVRLAREVADKLNVDFVKFINKDICDLDEMFDVDTIFQNPPFGSQRKAKKGRDLKFVKKALGFSANVLYSFHMASTEEYLINYYQNNDLKITHIFRYKFPIPNIYEFHTKEKKDIDVIVFRAIV